ncbi:MAG: hypothetical protein WBE26_06055 [Phycisphaerae bacterium]
MPGVIANFVIPCRIFGSIIVATAAIAEVSDTALGEGEATASRSRLIYNNTLGKERSARHHEERGSEKQDQGEARLRIEVGASDGDFIVYDATLPPASPRATAGYLAYWHDFETEQIYVYGRLMFEWVDVGHALLNLDPDLWIDPAPLIEASPMLEDAVAEAQLEDEDPTQWHPATDPLVLEIMGIEPPPDMPADAGFNKRGDDGAVPHGATSHCPRPKSFIYCPGGCYDGNPCTKDYCDMTGCECVHERLQTRGLVWEITFTGDQPMYESAEPYDGDNVGWGVGPALTGVDWHNLSVYNPDHPICYTRGASVTMNVVIYILVGSEGTATLRVVGPDGMNGTADFPLTCGLQQRTVSITASNFPNVVEAYEPMRLYWYVKSARDTEYTRIVTTPHNTYVSYGTPIAGSPTKERMSFLCNAAIGQSAQVDVTDGIHVALDADPPNDPPEHDEPHLLTDDWPIMCPDRLPSDEIYVGYCDHQARFMLRGMNLMGIAGSTYDTFASSDTTVHLPEKKVEDGKTWWLKFDFDDNGEIDNNFEGSVIAFPRYYTVWPSVTADSECLLLRQIGPDPPGAYGATQRWVRTAPPGGFYDPTVEQLPGVEGYPSCP